MKDESKHIKVKFRMLGLPKVVTWEETDVKPSVRRKVETALPNAPSSGILLVSGVASPIIQEFFKVGRKVAAVNYVEFFNTKFTDTDYVLPNSRAEQVTLIYNVGMEPVNNFEYSSKVLQGLMSKFSSGLVVIETSMTPSNFNIQYGLDLRNKFIIPKKSDIVWT